MAKPNPKNTGYMTTVNGRTYIPDKGKMYEIKAFNTYYEDGKKKTRNRITPRQFQVADMHVNGMANKDIAKTLGISHTNVRRYLCIPEVKILIDEYYEAVVHQDMKALAKIAVDNLRTGLLSKDSRERFEFTKLYFATNAQYEREKKTDDNHDSAEDLIQKMIQVQVNINQPKEIIHGSPESTSEIKTIN